MKQHLFRLVVTMLALCSGTAFASIPSTSEHVLRTEPTIVGTVVAVGGRSDRYETSSTERGISARPVYERRYRASDYNRDHEAASRNTLISGDEQRSRMATNYDDTPPADRRRPVADRPAGPDCARSLGRSRAAAPSTTLDRQRRTP